MPNPIKYTTGSETDALKKGNFYIGTGSVGKGPSDTTGYYQGPNVPSGGYVIYMNRDEAPGDLSYHVAANDAELIAFTNNLSGQSYTGVQQCFDYYYGENNKVLVNQDYPADYPYIVMDGLVLNLDAGITQSYSGSGTVWVDINGLGPRNNADLINGPTFSGDSFIFDGADDYALVSYNITGLSSFTVEAWVKTNGLSNSFDRIVSCRTTDNTRRMTLNGVQELNKFNFTVETTNNGNVSIQSTSSVTTDWTHVVGVYNGSQSKIFINGTLENSTNVTGDVIGSNQNIFSIGKDVYRSRYFWNGNISSINFYEGVSLSDSEVLQNYNAQKGRFGL